MSGRIQLWGHAIAVDWAEPEVEVDEDTMATVKILYVRNLMLQTTEETIEKEFNSLRPGMYSPTVITAPPVFEEPTDTMATLAPA